MTRQEYEYLQERLSKKLHAGYPDFSPKREEGYKEGILAAKSILKSVYHEYEEKEEEDKLTKALNEML